MSELLNEKNEIEKSYRELLEELSKYEQELVTIINRDISTDELAEKDIRKNILNINKTLIELQNKSLSETKILSSQRVLLQNKSKEEYETWAKEIINSYRVELEKLKSTFQALNDKLSKDKEQQQIIIKKLEVEESGLQALENSESISITIQKNLNNIKDSSDTIKILETELQESKEENVTNEINQINESLIRISTGIDIYKLNAGKYINSDIDKMDESVFNDSIVKLKEENEKKISDYNDEIKQLELLSELKDNVLPYLEFEENKKIENNIK
ncbi:hypothetical protein OSTOST_12628, partial [Ostertagia ostertagi]